MLLGYNVFKSRLNEIDFDGSKCINTINPHSFCVAKRDDEFKKALEDSDILLPDGIGIVWAEKFLNGNVIKRIAGYDLFLFLMHKLNQDNGSVFFLGASNETLDKIEAKCKIEFPNVTFGGYSPPYKSVFTEKDSKAMCDAVNAVNPDVLFVGMTAPKQEKWVYQFKDQLQARNICAIGAVFDFYAGNVKRAPRFFIRFGLEWVHRSLMSRRLFERNFVSNPKFIYYIFKIKITKLLSK